MLPTARRYLLPTVLGAPGRRISAVVTVVVVVVAAEGAAAAFGPEEPEGLSAQRLVVVGGGADLLFRGGIGSIPGELAIAGTLRLLLEQEPEVFSLGLGLILLGDDPEIELLHIPMQRSQLSGPIRESALDSPG